MPKLTKRAIRYERTDPNYRKASLLKSHTKVTSIGYFKLTRISFKNHLGYFHVIPGVHF